MRQTGGGAEQRRERESDKDRPSELMRGMTRRVDTELAWRDGVVGGPTKEMDPRPARSWGGATCSPEAAARDISCVSCATSVITCEKRNAKCSQG